MHHGVGSEVICCLHIFLCEFHDSERLQTNALAIFSIQISYGRIPAVQKGHRDIDLFLQQKDGKKMVDPERENLLCSCLKMEMLHPLRVLIANRGPDTELLVANPVELSGRGRPRVFHDATLALKKLGICIFSVRIQHSVIFFFCSSSFFIPCCRFDTRLSALCNTTSLGHFFLSVGSLLV